MRNARMRRCFDFHRPLLPVLCVLFHIVLLGTCRAQTPGAESGGSRRTPSPVYILPVAGAIGPVTARFLTEGIARAERENARPW